MEKIDDFICLKSKDSVMVYTDGSVYGGEAGSGACSAILYPPTASGTVSHRTRAVGRMVSIDECENDGISLGIETAIDYFKNTSPGVHEATVYILCDSLSAIHAVNRRDSCIPLHVLNRFDASSQELVAAGINIKLLNIPGHSGIKGNIEADKHAKDTAYKVYKGYMAAPMNVSIKTAFNLSSDIATRSWQRMWDNDLSGRYTHNLIPCVNSKVVFPLARDIGISYCRLLLHDSMLKDDSFRSGTSDSPICECGSGKETSEHYLFDCCRYRKQREELLDQLLQLRDKNHKTLATNPASSNTAYNAYSACSAYGVMGTAAAAAGAAGGRPVAAVIGHQ